MTDPVPPDRRGDVDDRLTLLGGLLLDAFKHYGNSTPEVLSVKSSDEDAVGPSLPLGWPENTITDPEDLGSVVSSQLSARSFLLVPPWGQRRDETGQRLAADQHEYVVLECQPGDPRSVLAVLTPVDTWVSLTKEEIREEIRSKWDPVLLLYGEGVIPSFHSSLRFAVAFLVPRRDECSLLRIFQLPRREDAEVVVRDFRRLLRQDGGRGKFGYVLRELPPSGESLGFDRHDPELQARRAELDVLGVSSTIGELFAPGPIGINRRDDRSLMHRSPVQGDARVIRGRDVQRDGVLAEPDEDTMWASVAIERQVKSGDILLRRMVAPHDQGLVTVEVEESALPVVADETIMVLRPKEALTVPERIVILSYLRSPLAGQLAAAASGGQRTLSWRALQEVRLPQPDEPFSAALEDLARAAKQFEQWQVEARSLLSSIFADDSAVNTRTRIVGQGRKVRLRSDAAALLDDVSYTFRTTYPYPLAHRWRAVEADVSAGAYREAYEAILAAAEVLQCYVANVGMAVARETKIELGSVTMIGNRLQPGGHGLGLGDWFAIVKEVRAKRSAREVPDGNPLGDLRDFLADDDAEDARKRLSERRNDESHLRKVELLDLPAAVDAALADLSTLYQAASFLSDLPLVHVTDVRWNSFERRATVSYRELTGDHPVVPTRKMTYGDPGIEKGSAYVLDGQRRLWLLRPFLSGITCPRCRNWTLFHIDGMVGEKVMYKCLERGHTIYDAALDDSLRHVGILAREGVS